MKLLELGDSISRFRVSQSCVGLVGCLCVIYAVWTPFWLNNRGLWTPGNDTKTEPSNNNDVFYGEKCFTLSCDSRASQRLLEGPTDRRIL